MNFEYIEASLKRRFKKKAEEIFGKNVETFLRFPEVTVRGSDGKYAKVNGIECTIAVFQIKVQVKKPYYYYSRFDSDAQDGIMPNLPFRFAGFSLKHWRNVETFWKEALRSSRMMCNYWVNIKTGDPNGNDVDGKPTSTGIHMKKKKPCETSSVDRLVGTVMGDNL